MERNASAGRPQARRPLPALQELKNNAMAESRVQKSLLNAKVDAVFYVLTLALAFFSRKIYIGPEHGATTQFLFGYGMFWDIWAPIAVSQNMRNIFLRMMKPITHIFQLRIRRK
ncbi:MAG: hypothetical protein LUG84_04545 [Akkermansiaceae bacterium]|nr:hypothetical protein [Akkermansiaceae bacterium]